MKKGKQVQKKVAQKNVNVEFSPSVDSESDEENTPDVIGNEEYDFLFGSDIYSDFEGFDKEEMLSTDPNFTPTKNRSHKKNRDELTNVQQKTAVVKNAPEGFSMDNWKKGDSEVMPKFPFTGAPRLKIEITDDGDKLYFLKLFVDKEIIASLTLQTNEYAADFIQTNAQKLGEHSRFSKWPKDRIKTNKMLAFIVLTYYMGIVEKDLITSYWSVDITIATPFPRTVMSRNEFENIFAFLHCCDSSEYATKGQPGYNPKKKLGFTYEKLVENFCNIWSPRKNITIDEGVISFTWLYKLHESGNGTKISDEK